jgi:hypothetical protein
MDGDATGSNRPGGGRPQIIQAGRKEKAGSETRLFRNQMAALF